MNTARIVVLTISVGAGGLAAYLASGSDKKPDPAQTVQLPTVDVLVAKSDIPLGQAVTASDVAWQTWPADSASSSFIRCDRRPDAPTQLEASIARSPFIAGEPIHEPKLVSAKGSGFMAAILPTGMRAISTEISPATGAGGFIIPNDCVDVILPRREKNADRPIEDPADSEAILSNVRVLAVDQTIEEKNGQKVVVGRTATLELKSEHPEKLARSRQIGTLSRALRRLADANAPESKIDDGRRDSINVVRYGVSTQTTVQR